MAERSSLIQLVETREWVPRIAAKCEAIVVYSEFAYNLGCMEELSALSTVVRSGFDIPTSKSLLRDNTVERLTRRDYFSESIGSLASRLTLRGTVAANMIVPDLEDGVVYGHAQEPFIGISILGGLHTDYMKKLETRRTLDEQSFLNDGFVS